MASSTLGDYLKSRRDRLRPEDVGLTSDTRRRVSGLRREEIAALAGISPDYYLRLEQGRNLHPSAQVINALAQALLLDATATAYLHALAQSKHQRDHTSDRQVMEGVASLVDQLKFPAFVAGRYFDVVASNQIARALSPNFVPGRNLLEALFLDPAERRLHVDWDAATAGVVGGLRQGAGSQPDDARLQAIVADLSARSDRFATLWSRADIGYRAAGSSHMHHPQVGKLVLQRNRFDIPDSGGQHLQVYRAAAGTKTARSLARLTSP